MLKSSNLIYYDCMAYLGLQTEIASPTSLQLLHFFLFFEAKMVPLLLSLLNYNNKNYNKKCVFQKEKCECLRRPLLLF